MTTPSENKRFYPHKISSLIKCHIARKKKKTKPVNCFQWTSLQCTDNTTECMPNQYKNNKRTFTEPQRRAREIMGEGENDHKWGDDSYPDVLMYMTVAVIHHFMYTLMHTCLHVFFKVQVQQNDLTNIQRVKQTTQRARLVNLSHVAERRAMRCNEVWLQSKTVRLHKWVYGHKTSCHRESELVHHRLGQRAKSEPLARCINTHPTPPISTHGTTNRREHRRKKTSPATKETDQTALHNLRNGMFFFTQTPPSPQPRTLALHFTGAARWEGDKWKLKFLCFLISVRRSAEWSWS